MPEEAQKIGAQLAAEYAELVLNREAAVARISQKHRLKCLSEELMLHRRRLDKKYGNGSGEAAAEARVSIDYLDSQIAEAIGKLAEVAKEVDKMKSDIRHAESMYQSRITVFCLHHNLKSRPGSITP